MSFGSKLTSDLKDFRGKHTGPSSYKPARPGEVPLATSEGLLSHSTVLQQQLERHKPLPPPRRGAPVVTAARETPTPPYSHARGNDLPVEELSRVASGGGGGGRKKFSQYGREEKDELFTMLDQFFEARLNVSGDASAAAAPKPRGTTTAPVRQAPPQAFAPSPSAPPTSLYPSPTGSYPPPQTHSSAALSLLSYILQTPFPTPWFTSSSPSPPPLDAILDKRMSGSRSQTGDSKSVTQFVLFGDSSVCWFRITWSARAEQDGSLDSSGMRGVKREGRYRPIPTPWDGERLYLASEKYGGKMVEFVEKAVRSQRPVARGECWDVASEALEYVAKEVGERERPLMSVGRTHGHLMYWAEAGKGGKSVWRGGEQYVRAGDVVEWRKVTIEPGGGVTYTLGAPDHTAVIVAAGAPTQLPEDGQPYPIAALVSLTVVEQSQGQNPTEQTYDMTGMTKGEVWIYRPVSLVEYIGTEINADWPPRCECWELGQLE